MAAHGPNPIAECCFSPFDARLKVIQHAPDIFLTGNVFPLPTMDVRLGNPAYVGGQQSRSSPTGLGRGLGARLAVSQWLCPWTTASER